MAKQSATEAADDSTQLGQRLRSAREELGLSTDQLFAESDSAPQMPNGNQDLRLPVVQPAASRSSLDLDSGVTWDRLTAGHDPNVDFLQTTSTPTAPPAAASN